MFAGRRTARRKTAFEFARKGQLIPWNPGELPFQRPDPARVDGFRRILLDKGVLVFVRDSRGQDVMAACGQLALSEFQSSPANVPISAS